jgi:hypothetical protein
MYAYAHDRILGTMVGMLTRPFDEDSDNQRLLESIAKQQADAPSPASTVGVFILIVDPSYPNPNARWRRKFAEMRDDARFGKALFALVTPAPHLRGVLTAVNWMRPPTTRFEAESFVMFDDAVRWVEEKRGQKLPALQRLLDDVHEKLGYPSSQNSLRPRLLG